MRITKISVRELFGNPAFDYDIELNQDPPITILHGRNGTGKTVIFKMIAGLFNAKNYGQFIFWKYPFSKFCLEFDDGESVTVSRTLDTKSGDYSSPKIRYSKEPKKDIDLNVLPDQLLRLPRSLRNRILHDLGVDNVFREIAKRRLTDDIEFHFLELARSETRRKKKKRDDNWLPQLSSKLKVDLIDTNRLIISISDEDQDDREEKSGDVITAAIGKNSEDLSDRIQRVINLRDNLANTLDRSFPRKVVDEVLSEDDIDPLEYESIKKALIELEDRRTELVQVGLLEPGEQKTEFQIPDEGEKVDLNPTLRIVLQRYIGDTRQKLGEYQELAEKINLFKEIVQGMLADKEFSITKKGFEFKRGERLPIPPTELSSGEQHIIVLMYNLLFRDWEKDREKSNELIMIDEPEISLHIDWQEEFVNNLKKIAALTSEDDAPKTDIMIATHSPAITHEHWDLEVVLAPKSGEAQ